LQWYLIFSRTIISSFVSQPIRQDFCFNRSPIFWRGTSNQVLGRKED